MLYYQPKGKEDTMMLLDGLLATYVTGVKTSRSDCGAQGGANTAYTLYL